jgi:hypothetical protein
VFYPNNASYYTTRAATIATLKGTDNPRKWMLVASTHVAICGLHRCERLATHVIVPDDAVDNFSDSDVLGLSFGLDLLNEWLFDV